MKKINGFSLIEMLCVIAISMIIVISLLDVLLGYQQAFKINQAILEIQENARFAIYTLKKEVSEAGFIGCPKLSESLPVLDAGVDVSDKLFYYNALGVYDSTNWQSNLPSNFKLKPKLDSNILLVRRIASNMNVLLESAKKTRLLRVSLKPEFDVGDNIAISDCKKVIEAKVQKVYRSIKNNYQQLTLLDAIQESFLTHAEVGELTTTVFVIQATSRKNKSGDKIYALYKVDSNGRKTELVSGVFDMHVFCIEQLLSGVILIKKPNEVLNWSNVKMLKIELLLRSRDNVLAQPKPYYFDGKKYLPSDKRLYRSIVSYVSING